MVQERPLYAVVKDRDKAQRPWCPCVQQASYMAGTSLVC